MAMATEDHPLYPKWCAALDRVIAAKEMLEVARQGTPSWTAAESEYQAALMAYDAVARVV
jgi:hypothetical protein